MTEIWAKNKTLSIITRAQAIDRQEIQRVSERERKRLANWNSNETRDVSDGFQIIFRRYRASQPKKPSTSITHTHFERKPR